MIYKTLQKLASLCVFSPLSRNAPLIICLGQADKILQRLIVYKVEPKLAHQTDKFRKLQEIPDITYQYQGSLILSIYNLFLKKRKFPILHISIRDCLILTLSKKTSFSLKSMVSSYVTRTWVLMSRKYMQCKYSSHLFYEEILQYFGP